MEIDDYWINELFCGIYVLNGNACCWVRGAVKPFKGLYVQIILE
jgi:hypothetical protein